MSKKKNTKKQKIYVLDTNVFMSNPDCIGTFDDNIIIVPDTVIEELDDNKNAPGDKGYNTRQALRNFDALRKKGSLLKGVKTENGGIVRVESNFGHVQMPDTWKDSPDNRILKVAKGLAETQEELPVIMVSKDTNVRIKADILGLKAEDYKHEMIDEDHLIYNGRGEIFLSSKDFESFIKNGIIDMKAAKFPNGSNNVLLENEFLLIANDTTMGTKLGMVHNGNITTLRYENCTPYDVVPRNMGQRFCIEALLSPAKEIPLVILKGSAGTAKTFLTLACGLEQCAEQQIYRKITITRANVEFDRDIGALPGSEESKVGPLLRGCMDNLELLVDSKGVKGSGRESDIQGKVQYLLDKGYISTEALGFLRGRSLTRQILYVDEAQNTTTSQMKGILTRVGEGTKLVLSGDLNQIDNPRLDKHNNGLAYALKLMAGDPLCCIMGFTDEETTRSPLAAKVASLI